MSGHSASTSAYQSLAVRLRDVEEAERVLAEALEAGAVGAEQREAGEGVTLVLYAPRSEIAAVAAACRALGTGALEPPADLDAVDWSEAWKAGLRAVEISPRLRVRPPFDASPLPAGQQELVIEPGQAFGTGGHESTRLALAWLDALRPALDGARVLDAGVGSGVLALAALRLGARWALGFDLDPLAAPAARANARANGLTRSLSLFTGPLEALDPAARFDGIAANLLRRELEPLLPILATRLQSEAWFVIAGLLVDELPGIELLARAEGLRLEAVKSMRDASGVEWIGALMRRAPRRAAR